jgi:hypothetical protein
MAADIEVIWVGREPEYFCNRDWTGVIRLIGFNNLGCARMPVAAEFEASGLSASNN